MNLLKKLIVEQKDNTFSAPLWQKTLNAEEQIAHIEELCGFFGVKFNDLYLAYREEIEEIGEYGPTNRLTAIAFSIVCRFLDDVATTIDPETETTANYWEYGYDQYFRFGWVVYSTVHKKTINIPFQDIDWIFSPGSTSSFNQEFMRLSEESDDKEAAKILLPKIVAEVKENWE